MGECFCVDIPVMPEQLRTKSRLMLDELAFKKEFACRRFMKTERSIGSV